MNLWRRDFPTWLAGVTAALCIVAPAGLWIAFSVKAGRLLEFPGSVTGFIASASTLALGFLALDNKLNPPPP